jgi:hypothetical protein
MHEQDRIHAGSVEVTYDPEDRGQLTVVITTEDGGQHLAVLVPPLRAEEVALNLIRGAWDVRRDLADND